MIEELKTKAISEINSILETQDFTIDTYSKIVCFLRDLKNDEIIKENN